MRELLSPSPFYGEPAQLCEAVSRKIKGWGTFSPLKNLLVLFDRRLFSLQINSSEKI